MSTEIVPTKTLMKRATKGIGGIAGGAALFGLSSMGPMPSLIVGGLLAVGGLSIATVSPEDRKYAGVVAGAGALTALTAIPLVGNITNFLMFGGGVALIGMGVYGLVQFFQGLRTRK